MEGQKSTSSRLRDLIEEAIVDAYGDVEQEAGFLVMLENNLPFPFKAFVVGEEVEVRGVDQGAHDREIVAICKGREYRVSITSLEWQKTGAVLELVLNCRDALVSFCYVKKRGGS